MEKTSRDKFNFIVEFIQTDGLSWYTLIPNCECVEMAAEIARVILAAPSGPTQVRITKTLAVTPLAQ